MDIQDIIVAGDRGPTGPTGPVGLRGPSGPSGYGYYVRNYIDCSPITGPVGNPFIGPSGLMGPTGFSGLPGPSGPSGYPGINYHGPSGLSGPSGARGVSGPSGSRGPSGLMGPSGYSGTSSLLWLQRIFNFTFLPGPSGPRGPSGPSGVLVAGPSGFPGPSGPSGVSGPTNYLGVGPSGPRGPSGFMGPSGPDNYASGPRGPSGPRGLEGPSGPSGLGPSGARGKTGFSGFITSTNSLKNTSYIARNSNSVGLEDKIFYNLSSNYALYETSDAPALTDTFSINLNTKYFISINYSGGGNVYYYYINAKYARLSQGGNPMVIPIYKAFAGNISSPIKLSEASWESLYPGFSSNFKIYENIESENYATQDSSYILIKSAEESDNWKDQRNINQEKYRTEFLSYSSEFKYASLDEYIVARINGNKLISIYNEYSNMNLNKPFTIFLSKGIYDLGGRSLRLISNFIKIIGLGAIQEDVKIISSLSDKGIGVIDQKTSKIHLENLSIINTYKPSTGSIAENSDLYLTKIDPYHRCAFSNSNTKFYLTDLNGLKKFSFRKVFIENNMSRTNYVGVPIDGNICFISESIDRNGSGLIFVQENPTTSDMQNFNFGEIDPANDPHTKIWKLYFVTNLRLNGNTFEPKNTDGIYVTTTYNVLRLIAIDVPSLNSSNYPNFSAWPWQVNNWYLLDTSFGNFNLIIDDLDNMKKSILKNISFFTSNYAVAMASYGFYAGNFSNCLAGFLSFGGINGYLTGSFNNCIGGDYSFTFNFNEQRSINRSKIINCEAGAYSFGGPMGKIDGLFKNLKINGNYPSNMPLINITDSSKAINIVRKNS